jgi:hypothetical protein
VFPDFIDRHYLINGDKFMAEVLTQEEIDQLPTAINADDTRSAFENIEL